MTIEKYEKQAAIASAEGKILRKKSDQLSWTRLIVFIIGVAVFIYLFSVTWIAALLFFVVFLLGFGRFVAYQQRLEAKASFFEQIANINVREVKFLNHDIQAFDKGEDFLEPEHPYSLDLDIFGNYSFFQYINRSVTAIGRKRLAFMLKYPATAQEIALRQNAIAELADNEAFRHEFMALGQQATDELSHINQLNHWLEKPNIVLGNRMLEAALWVVPITFVGICYLVISTQVWSLSMLFFVLPAIVSYFILNKVNEAHQDVSKIKNILEKYASLIQSVENQDFRNEKLILLKNNLFDDKAKNATAALRRLAYLSAQLDARLNILAFVFQLSVLWDAQYIYRLDKWKMAYKNALPRWFESLQELDALISMASAAHNNPDWIFPKLSYNANLKAVEMGHPLLHVSKRICNDFEMPTEGHLKLLTGSNMAGKSTFLRTIGSNIVLASIGMPVCAKQFESPILHVYSSMRTQDELSESTSSFYAELKRLKTIIEATEARKDIFFLLDEILKGTNSNDRHTGSKALINQMIDSKGAGIVATHDLELGTMAQSANGTIENLCMEVDIINDRLSFDYKLKKGVSKSFNATYLMRSMGIKC